MSIGPQVSVSLAIALTFALICRARMQFNDLSDVAVALGIFMHAGMITSSIVTPVVAMDKHPVILFLAAPFCIASLVIGTIGLRYRIYLKIMGCIYAGVHIAGLFIRE